MHIILDAGHGETTPGKRSPDGKFREYKYCREIMAEVKKQLEDKGYQVSVTVDTDEDIHLNTRCKYANSICSKYGNNNTLLVSIHCNAAGMGDKWLTARGWCVFVANNCSDKSKNLANSFVKSAEECGLKVRKYSKDQPYWKQSLAICRDTKCPAVLTENLFMDNKQDLEFLESEYGRQTIVKLHVDGIVNYINSICNKN